MENNIGLVDCIQELQKMRLKSTKDENCNLLNSTIYFLNEYRKLSQIKTINEFVKNQKCEEYYYKDYVDRCDNVRRTD